MSVYNGIGEQGFAELLTRRLRTAGPSPAPAVAPELFPVLTLENDRPEWGYLKGERLGMGFAAIAADAANLSFCQIGNPLGSNAIVVVEKVCYASGAGTSWYRTAYQPAPTPGVTAGRDFRWPAPGINQNTIARVEGGVLAAAVPLELARFANTALSTVTYELNIVLPPGTMFTVWNRAVNFAISANFLFRERIAQPGELV